MILNEQNVLLKNGQQCVIKSPREDDACQMISFLKETAKETDFMVRNPEETDITVEEEQALISKIRDGKQSIFIAAFLEEKLVGNIGIYPIIEKAKTRHRLGLGISILKEVWGLGIGGILVQAGIQFAKSIGCEQLELGVMTANKRAIHLYQKFGFQTFGILPKAFCCKDGTYYDEQLMVLPLKRYDTILFDLDGTLTDSKKGITSCVQYALRHFQIEVPNADDLECFIGPPLHSQFMEQYQFSEEQAHEAVLKYRERYQTIGIFENDVYEGIPALLASLKAQGKSIGLASSKPEVFCERILKHYQLRQYFDVVAGSDLIGERQHKDQVVEEALRRFGISEATKEHVVLIGDRKYDAEGARKQGIDCIGVTYGYGSFEELVEWDVVYVAREVAELEAYFNEK